MIGVFFLLRTHCLELDLINLTGLQEDLGKIVVTVQITPKATSDGTSEVCCSIFVFNGLLMKVAE